MSLVNDAILEKLNSLIVIVNQSGSVEYVSPSAKRILGFEPEQLIGEGWWDLTRDNFEDRELNKSLVIEQFKQDCLLETLSYERLLRTAAGGDRWILWNTSKGPLNTLVGIGHDITERKKAEKKLLDTNKELTFQNKEMLESIQYASRIQAAILPDIEKFKKAFKDAFVLYQPKDVVSGDYYFFCQKDSKIFVAAVDCTGHGVPGALMSVIADGILKEVVVKKQIENPAEILYELDKELYISLNRNNVNTVTNDGMDVAIGVFDFESNTMSFAGAFRPGLLVRDNEIIELEASRYPIGYYAGIEKVFTSQTIDIKQGDAFYFFSDGYCDQFGGEKMKKFNRKRFKELLLSVQNMTMEEQEAYLQYVLLNWRQEEPQVDDILVLGIKL